TWQADGAYDPNGAEGGYRPDRDVCILLMTTHTHKRGTHVKITYEEDGKEPVTLFDPVYYDYVHPAGIAPAFHGSLPDGNLLRDLRRRQRTSPAALHVHARQRCRGQGDEDGLRGGARRDTRHQLGGRPSLPGWSSAPH